MLALSLLSTDYPIMSIPDHAVIQLANVPVLSPIHLNYVR